MTCNKIISENSQKLPIEGYKMYYGSKMAVYQTS